MADGTRHCFDARASAAPSDFYLFRCAVNGCGEIDKVSAAGATFGRARLYVQRVIGWRLVPLSAREGERLVCPLHAREIENDRRRDRFLAFLKNVGIVIDGASA